MKKLNRKGFTLIELLAVIVILAVIMVIASSSVLSSMNNSKKKSLVDSAMSAADSFDTAYATYTLTNTGGINGISGTNLTGLLTGTKQNLSGTGTADALGINSTDYDLGNSYVYYSQTNAKFTVCFVANTAGSFYLAEARSKVAKTIDTITLAKDLMWACSDGTNSWDDAQS